MATPRTRTTRTRTARSLIALVAALALAAVLPLTGAVAEPGSTSTDARRELAELNRRVDQAVEDYSEVRIALSAAQKRAAAAQGRVRRAEAELKALQAEVGEFAAAAYMAGGQDQFVQLMTNSDPQTFLDRAASLDQIARGRDLRMQQVRTLRRRLVAEQQAAAKVLDQQRLLERRAASVRGSIESQVTRQEQLLGRLESAEARAQRLEQARRSARASRERLAAAPQAAYAGPASGRAAIAVREAYRQLGKPYRWGAEGPNAFDCSGLTMWVWAKAGVSLPHSSRAQFRHGVKVSKSQLQPGDLVFYGSPIHHVGIYVGGGRYIAAPQTGDVVGFRNVNRGDWAGAVRL